MESNHNLNEPNLKSINFRPPVVPLSILYIHSTHEATCSKISGNLRFQFFNVYCSCHYTCITYCLLTCWSKKFKLVIRHWKLALVTLGYHTNLRSLKLLQQCQVAESETTFFKITLAIPCSRGVFYYLLCLATCMLIVAEKDKHHSIIDNGERFLVFNLYFNWPPQSFCFSASHVELFLARTYYKLVPPLDANRQNIVATDNLTA